MTDLRIAVVTPLMASGEKGGAENFYEGLVGALRRASHDAVQVEVPVDESSFDGILASYLACRDLDLSAYDLVISTKAPTYMVRHPNHLSYLVHTIRVFYDRFEAEFGPGTPELHEQRRVIHTLDIHGLHPERVRRHFTIGHTNYRRLHDADPFWRGIAYEPLHPPTSLQGFHRPRPGEYVFLPGRLHRWKRVDLIIEAFKRLPADIPLKIAGSGEDEASLRALAAGDRRIEFLGRVNDDELRDLYAGALVVPFVPVQEDYGLVAVEAFLSQKPVITCRDSGEPTYLVADGENGFVVDPDPDQLAGRLAELIARPDLAAAMGQRAQATVAHISWDRIAARLLAAGAPAVRRNDEPRAVAVPETAGPAAETDGDRLPTVVLDMQPIDPPVGGGRMRLLGLYHALGERLPTTYYGTYDWPGEPPRRQALSGSLEERLVPLSAEHFAAAEECRERAGGRTVIDVAFARLAHHSADFLRAAREGVVGAEIVVFSHPWVYPLVKDDLRPGSQLIVYDAQNVEGVLRTVLLDDQGFGTELVREVLAVEQELCRSADLILACSHADRVLFHELYGVPYRKILVVPNGTFTGSPPPDEAGRREARRALGVEERRLVVFLGSAYQPNVEAAEFILGTLAPALPEVEFAICGGVGSALSPSAVVPANARVTGSLAEDEKRAYLAAADMAVNPMLSGSGTAVKMFDFMAAGLPIVTSPVGARGISPSRDAAFEVAPPEQLAGAVRRLLADPNRAAALGAAARRLVAEQYSWERISPNLGRRLRLARRSLGRPAPLFSVVVASYERPDSLAELIDCLEAQSCRDFEIVVVDQSDVPWADAERCGSERLLYLHTDVRGAVGARNLGAFHARGEILAFTDDDCRPEPDWLQSAGPYFDDPAVVGVEGLITSERRDDPDYRAVTNIGFEGIGFMTANLLIRRETFMAVDGFDGRFDHPHFREDTDLGWRASQLGRIPFGHDVRVYHPPHRRAVEREGTAERNRFFEKDALLLKKHPERYRTLFLHEGHYARTPGFREHFLRGAEKYDVLLDGFYLSLLSVPGCGADVGTR